MGPAKKGPCQEVPPGRPLPKGFCQEVPPGGPLPEALSQEVPPGGPLSNQLCQEVPPGGLVFLHFPIAFQAIAQQPKQNKKTNFGTQTQTTNVFGCLFPRWTSKNL